MFQLITERLSLPLSNGARHRDVIGAPTDADARAGHTSAHQTFCGYRVSTLLDLDSHIVTAVEVQRGTGRAAIGLANSRSGANAIRYFASQTSGRVQIIDTRWRVGVSFGAHVWPDCPRGRWL